MINDYIRMNYVVVITMGFLLLFFWTSTAFNKKISALFEISAIAIVITSLAESAVYLAPELQLKISAIEMLQCIGLFFRPVSACCIILIMANSMRLRIRHLLVAPIMISELLVVWMYIDAYFIAEDEASKLINGPISHSATVCVIFYLMLLLGYSIFSSVLDKAITDLTVLIAVVIMTVAAVALNGVLDIYEFQNSISAICLTFFYLYYHNQSFKKDALTGVFNRRVFEIDTHRLYDTLTAIVAIDLNNLKKINDYQGHAEGDKAICTMVKTVRRSRLPGCNIYRTGGDEFIMLCTRHSIIEIYHMVDDITERMKKTPYSWAMGVVDVTWGTSKEELLDKVDEAMYANKKAMKMMAFTNEEDKKNN